MKIVSSNIDEIHAKILEQFKMSGDLTPIIPQLNETIRGLVDDKFIEQKGWDSTIRGGSILSDTGGLSGSVTVNVVKSVNGFTIELQEKFYGAFHEYGANITVTPKSKKFFWYKYKETGNEVWKNMALTKKKYFVLPIRSHLALTEDDKKEIFATIQDLLS